MSEDETSGKEGSGTYLTPVDESTFVEDSLHPLNVCLSSLGTSTGTVAEVDRPRRRSIGGVSWTHDRPPDRRRHGDPGEETYGMV